MKKSALLLTFFCIFNLYCIAQPPDKPDPPFQLLQYLTAQAIQNETSDGSGTTTPAPSYNPSVISDTGQIACYTNAGAITACTGTGQDGEFTNVPNIRSFTGPTQHSLYTTDYTTLDNLRGLVWKTCPEGQTGAACAGAASVISWNAATLGGVGSCNALNAQNTGNGYAGRTNWRIPTVNELLSIVNYGNAPVFMETTEFPNADQSNLYLTITDYGPNTTMAWVVDFIHPGFSIQPFVKNANVFLRCVSGNPTPAPFFQDNGNGTITDRNTNLLWSKCPMGRSGAACAAGVLFVGNRNSALTNCDGLVLAGRSDWRLPNINELLSIVDYVNIGNPSILTAAFPNFPANIFWTSTTNQEAAMLSQSLAINFNNGQVGSVVKTMGASAICVTSPP
ncbi:Lcl C-terminal domain-containing protein [Leptospira sanjuanensis]|uniref:Lcl C-terminal domain-containing protein n=1 Tax=Leptospira sanjuanensis TaxID=2879643 RepID=UPI001EE89730|nr:DUF1566 domain-containing protein [Leptospira sanjuanensis]MCG6167024.1 DUF1566 domain-containing protein [Leptospira sanjuanensis]